MVNMVWGCLMLFVVSFSVALVSPGHPSSVKRFGPDLETQPSLFWTSFPEDASNAENTDFWPQSEDNSNLFSFLPDSITGDNGAGQFLDASDFQRGSILALDNSPCGSQDSSSGLSTDDTEVGLDLFSLNELDTRGFLEDVDKLNEVIDSPNDGSCPAPDMLNPQGQSTEPQVDQGNEEESDTFPKLDDEVTIGYPVDEFGKCPVLEPEYKEAVCCTGQPYGIYVLRCLSGIKQPPRLILSPGHS